MHDTNMHAGERTPASNKSTWERGGKAKIGDREKLCDRFSGFPKRQKGKRSDVYLIQDGIFVHSSALV